MSIDQLNKLEAAATPGPWRADVTQAGPCGQVMRSEYVVREVIEGEMIGYEALAARGPGGTMRKWRSDANLIAAARNALPALLAVAEAAAERAEAGHNDTCSKELQPYGGDNYACDCGHDALVIAVGALLEAQQ